MTLLITAATKHALYLSSDYRLSDKGKPVETSNGAKQLSVQGKCWIAQISFTGVARDGHGYDTRAWIRDVVKSLPPDAPVERLVDALVDRGTRAIATIQKFVTRLTLVVAAVENHKCRLFLLSNWEALFMPPPRGLAELHSREVTLTRPRVLVHGNMNTLPRSVRRRILQLVTGDSGRELICSTLAMANEFAARGSGGNISSSCWIQSLFSDGNSYGRNHGKVPGLPSSIHAGSDDMNKWISTEFPMAPGEQRVLLQSVGFMGRGIPAPTEIGEPRTIRVLSPATSVSITLGKGGPVIGALSTPGITGELTVRKNQYAYASLGAITFEGNAATLNAARTFVGRRLRMPCVPTVDGAQPRTWDYTFDVKFDDTTLEINARQNSMAFRSVNLPSPMPVLGPSEELLMVAPFDGLRMSVSALAPKSTGNIQGQFLLRDFPELRRGAVFSSSAS